MGLTTAIKPGTNAWGSKTAGPFTLIALARQDCGVQDPEVNAKILSSWAGGIQAVAQLFSYLSQLHIIGAGLVDATESCPVVGHIVGEALPTNPNSTAVIS